MIIPAPLRPGDKIAMLSVASKVDREYVEKASQLLESKKFRIEIGAHAFDTFHSFAGTDTDRASDMQQALDDPEVKAIVFNRGGYGTLRTLSLLDWSGFYQNPKWLIGFSDITVFHAYLSKNGVASIHGVMPAFFYENGERSESFDRLLELLRGNSLRYEIPPNRQNLEGKCGGKLIGGNLSILLSLRGTPLDQSLEGKVLFIEDISEFDYHIDRMMMNLKYGGALSKLSGLIVGYFTDTKIPVTPFGLDAYDIIRQAVAEYDFPVVFGFPAGHELPNYPLLMGSKVTLDVSEKTVVIEQKF